MTTDPTGDHFTAEHPAAPEPQAPTAAAHDRFTELPLGERAEAYEAELESIRLALDEPAEGLDLSSLGDDHA